MLNSAYNFGVSIPLVSAADFGSVENVASVKTSLAAPILALDGLVIHAGEVEHHQVTLTGTDVLTIEEGGVLKVRDDVAINWIGKGSNVTVENAGTISGAPYGLADDWNASFSIKGSLTFDNAATGVVLSSLRFTDLANGSQVTVNNHGLFSTFGSTLDFHNVGEAKTLIVVNNFADGVMTNTNPGGDVISAAQGVAVNNAGVIQSAADIALKHGEFETGGDGVDYGQNFGGMVHNMAGALIEGSRHGITGQRDLTVVNEAGGFIIGRNGSAINVDNNGDVDQTVHVTNYGTLQGKSADYDDSDGDAIDTDGLLQLDNYGLIQGLGAAGFHDGGLNTSEGLAIGGGVINNYAGGVIYSVQRAIQVDDSSEGPALAATVIYNEGRIEGGDGRAINIVGGFDDTLTNKGEIIGSVLMGGGTDTLNVYAGSSFSEAVDGGAGLDTVNLSGTGAGDFVGAANFENLNVESGDWAIGDTAGFKQIVVSGGARVTTTVHLDAADELSVSAGGRIAAAGGPSVVISGPVLGLAVYNQGTIGAFASDADAALSGDLSITNDAGGAIVAVGAKAAISLSGDLAGGALVIDNAGRIDGLSNHRSSAIALDGLNGGTVTLVNRVDGDIGARADSDIIRAAANMTIENFGVIEAASDVSLAQTGDAIDFGSNAGVTIHNSGYVSGAHDAIHGSAGVSIVNELGQYLFGNSGAAVNVDNDASVANTVHVINHGNMFGGSDAAEADAGDAIAVSGLLQLDNYSNVAGFGFGAATVVEGVAMGGGSIHNFETGLITSNFGAIRVDDGHGGGAFASARIVNEGRIVGEDGHAILIVGDFADKIVNSGSIEGDVTTGGGDDQISVLAGGTITGAIQAGGGDDTVIGAEGGERLLGQDGDDLLQGGGGADTLAGADGDDRFVFTAIGDSTVAASDVIKGLAAGDVIDVSAIDADATLDGDQAFSVVASFSGHAGELVLSHAEGAKSTILLADVDGDGVADFRIVLNGGDFSHFDGLTL